MVDCTYIDYETSEKSKMTIYLPFELVNSIEQVHLKFRHKVSRQNRHKLSKSKFCEIILEVMLKDHLEDEFDILGKIVEYWDSAESC